MTINPARSSELPVPATAFCLSDQRRPACASEFAAKFAAPSTDTNMHLVTDKPAKSADGSVKSLGRLTRRDRQAFVKLTR